MSLLKPRDIANVQFRTAWRGYNEADVDEFVQKMVGAYETLYHEYQKLQEEYGRLQARLEEYSQTEVQIDQTLAFARQAAREAKDAAEQHAKAILAKAELEAENIVRKAQRRVEEYTERALAVARQEALFRARLVEILDDYKALLERGRDEARQLTKAVAELADDAAAAADFDDLAEDGLPADEVPAGGDEDADDWPGDHRDGADDFDADDLDLEPTRRMEAMRRPGTEA